MNKPGEEVSAMNAISDLSQNSINNGVQEPPQDHSLNSTNARSIDSRLNITLQTSFSSLLQLARDPNTSRDRIV